MAASSSQRAGRGELILAAPQGRPVTPTTRCRVTSWLSSPWQPTRRGTASPLPPARRRSSPRPASAPPRRRLGLPTPVVVPRVRALAARPRARRAAPGDTVRHPPPRWRRVRARPRPRAPVRQRRLLLPRTQSWRRPLPRSQRRRLAPRSGGEDGEVAVFPLIRILDVDTVDTMINNNSTNLAVYGIAAHVAPVTCVTCGHGGSNAVFASASADGTCKVWNMADGAHLRTLTLSCTAFTLALDPTTPHLFAGGSDGCVHVASLISTDTHAATSAWPASGDTNAALVGVGMANGCKSLVSCTEDGEVRVWDLTSGSLSNTFRVGRAVSDVLVIKRLASDMVRDGGGEGFRVRDDDAWTRAGEAVEMGRMLRASEVDKTRSVELVEMAVGAYKRSLRLMLREVTTVANGRRASGRKGDGHVSD